MPRTKEDYAEIMATLEQFQDKRIWRAYEFNDGTLAEGETTFIGSVWQETCLRTRTPHRTASDVPPIVLAGLLEHICVSTRIEVWETGYRATGHECCMTATLLEP